MQGQWQPAVQLYTLAEEAARRGNDVVRQSDALSWRGLAQQSLRNLGQAVTDATQAVRLAETTADKDILAQALDVLGTAQLAQGDVAAAAATLNREVAVAAEAKKPMAVWFAYSNRSDVYKKTAETCNYGTILRPVLPGIRPREGRFGKGAGHCTTTRLLRDRGADGTIHPECRDPPCECRGYEGVTRGV